MKDYVCVVGGANIDISGTTFSYLNYHDSNPGKINTSLGGVGRNIAENLSRMGVNVEFISVFGNDNYSRDIKESCDKLNISLNYSETILNERTSTYLCINDEHGEMQLAVSDMDIYDNVTSSFLENRLHIINASRALIVDTNIPKNSLDYLMGNTKVPIFIDTVSTKKTEKIKDSIHNVYALKPNINEVEILSGIKIIDEDDLKEATDIILKKGVKQIYVSLGSDGVYYTDGINKNKLPTITDTIVNTTGAGDSFLAGVVWAFLQDYTIEMCAKAGLSASNICVKSLNTVSEEMSEEYIKYLIKNKWR